MNLLRRIRNLWSLSSIEIDHIKSDKSLSIDPGFLIDHPVKQAEIIKRTNPAKDFIKDEL